jgi:hypothetical protein
VRLPLLLGKTCGALGEAACLDLLSPGLGTWVSIARKYWYILTRVLGTGGRDGAWSAGEIYDGIERALRTADSRFLPCSSPGLRFSWYPNPFRICHVSPFRRGGPHPCPSAWADRRVEFGSLCGRMADGYITVHFRDGGPTIFDRPGAFRTIESGAILYRGAAAGFRITAHSCSFHSPIGTLECSGHSTSPKRSPI